jgi:hypothetical protein
MHDATMVHRAMLVLVRCYARDNSALETAWMNVGPVRIAFYPRSKTHTWFDNDGPCSSAKAMRMLKKYLGPEPKEEINPDPNHPSNRGFDGPTGAE